MASELRAERTIGTSKFRRVWYPLPTPQY